MLGEDGTVNTKIIGHSEIRIITCGVTFSPSSRSSPLSLYARLLCTSDGVHFPTHNKLLKTTLKYVFLHFLFPHEKPNRNINTSARSGTVWHTCDMCVSCVCEVSSKSKKFVLVPISRFSVFANQADDTNRYNVGGHFIFTLLTRVSLNVKSS